MELDRFYIIRMDVRENTSTLMRKLNEIAIDSKIVGFTTTGGDWLVLIERAG